MAALIAGGEGFGHHISLLTRVDVRVALADQLLCGPLGVLARVQLRD